MAAIRFEHVTKAYGDVVAVDDVSLDIADGEFLVLVGPSGCGKSTLLRMIAGLEDVTGGGIAIGDRDITWLAPKDRDVAMVFQTYALYPHMTVRQNLGYGLKARRTPKAEIARRVGDVAELLGLDDLLERRPSQLSGGQRQRVAMGRAIAREPQAFLLDEPLSNLDAKLRVGMRASLTQLHQRLGVTTVYVTHDQVEAMTLGQRVAVMREGKIVQVDTPHRLYAEPRDLFVAGFIGSPAMNLVEATVESGSVRFGQFTLPISSEIHVGDGPVVLGIRPESFEDAALAPTLPAIDVSVQVLEDLGSDAPVFFLADARPVTPEALETADDARVLIAGAGTLLTARVHASTAIRAGRQASLAVDIRGLHFFDPATGLRLAPAATPSPVLAQ
jgi:multiple sugar transport system ATP-binding protein